MASRSAAEITSSLEEVPRWMGQRARHCGIFSTARSRLLVVFACLLLGYATLSSYTFQNGLEHSSVKDDRRYGTLDLYDMDPDEGMGASVNRTQIEESKTSIKGALKGLHQAVSGKVSSWKTSLVGDSAGISEEITIPERANLGERMRIGKVTIIFGGSAIYERAVRTHETHDRIHGYPLHVLRRGIMDDVWSKPAYILSILLREMAKPEDERLQWLLWIDADTIVLNPYVPIETFLPPSPEFDDIYLVATTDMNGLNNGVFPIKVNEWSIDLLSAIVSFRYYRPDAQLTFRDQSAMAYLIKEPKFAKHIAWAPQRWFNAYQGEHNETLAPFQARRGDFLVHFAGVGDRNERMSYWLDRVEQHPPDWELNVRHTSYPTEAKEFWESQRAMKKENGKALADAKQKAEDLVSETDDKLRDYSSELEQSDVEKINEAKDKTHKLVEEAEVSVEDLTESISALRHARAVLDIKVNESKSKLEKSGHKAIWTAEKELSRTSDGNLHEVKELEMGINILKGLVMKSSWSKNEMTSAVEKVEKETENLKKLLDDEQSKQSQAAAVEEQAKAKEKADASAAQEKQKKELQEKEDNIQGAVATHTATIIENTTSVVIVMETNTVNPDAS